MTQPNKLLIYNNSPDKVSDREALDLVGLVIDNGRVSDGGECYCFGSKFELEKEGSKFEVMVYALRLKSGTDKFNVISLDYTQSEIKEYASRIK